MNAYRGEMNLWTNFCGTSRPVFWTGLDYMRDGMHEVS